MLDAERSAGIALRVEIDHQGPQSLPCQRRRNVDGGRRLPDATLLIGDGEQTLLWRSRQATLRSVHQTDGALGLGPDRGVDADRIVPRFGGSAVPCFT